MQSRPDGFLSLEEAAHAIAEYLPHRPRPGNLSGLQRNLKLRDDGRLSLALGSAFFLRRTSQMLMRESGVTPRPHGRSGSQRYCCAAAAVSLVTADNVRHFQNLIPHAEFVDVEDAAHMIAGDRNDAFNAAVIEFLDRV